MKRNPNHDVLFEPVQIGPVTAKNRFYQAPHCNGMGRTFPSSMAAMRGVKAEGGWAVVSTEQVDIHPSSDFTPSTETRLWSDQDVPYLARMCDAVHEHNALASIELCHSGMSASNLYSREVPLAPGNISKSYYGHPIQAREMTKSDIREFRRWHKQAALRAKRAGFDIICCYAAHNLTLPAQFLLPRFNDRSDEYGGSLENRVRLLREIIEDTKDAVGDQLGVVLRFSVDELLGKKGLQANGEGRDVIEMLADLPDLWDVCLSDWNNDSQTSRFSDEGFQEPFINFVKQVTSKPVVAVGRYTSSDRMAAIVRNGLVDMVGAARPSIADPFLPVKIDQGRSEDIRECIGCNICVAWDNLIAPMRCTQNPTASEEWRRGWHPEHIAPKKDNGRVLIVGAGPAGLEAALASARRGYEVILAEASEELGGRVTRESRLPGLSAWARVRDYRTYQLSQMSNVEIYIGSTVTEELILETEAAHVAIATGAKWRSNGCGNTHQTAIPGIDHMKVVTPDDIMAGHKLDDHVVVYDDDHYYLGSVIAEKLVADGCQVTLVTPSTMVAEWTEHTLEQHRIQARLLELGVNVIVTHQIKSVGAESIELGCIYSDRTHRLDASALVPVTSRLPVDQLLKILTDNNDELRHNGIQTCQAIGDCRGPSTIAAAVYEGHKFARGLGEPADDIGFRREVTELSSEFIVPTVS